MNHARRIVRNELAILLDTRRQVIADRSMPDRSAMLAEISREISELRDALSVLEGVIPSWAPKPAAKPAHAQRMGEGA